MLGVVLWSDRKRDRAVVWCEDHQNLAFFKCDPSFAGCDRGFEAGDLIEFELRVEDDLRLVVDPSLVAPQQYSALVRELMQGQGAGECTSLPTEERGSSAVIAFPKKPRSGEPLQEDLAPSEPDRRCEAG